MKNRSARKYYVYVYRNAHEIFYIGQSKDVHQRMKDHRLDYWYHRLPNDFIVEYHRFWSKEKVDNVEGSLIAKYEPTYNKISNYVRYIDDENMEWYFTSPYLYETESITQIKTYMERKEAFHYADRVMKHQSHAYEVRVMSNRLKRLEAQLIDYPIVYEKLKLGEFVKTEEQYDGATYLLELPLNEKLKNCNPRSMEKYPYYVHGDITDEQFWSRCHTYGISRDFYDEDFSRHFIRMGRHEVPDPLSMWDVNLNSLLRDIEDQAESIREYLTALNKTIEIETCVYQKTIQAIKDCPTKPTRIGPFYPE